MLGAVRYEIQVERSASEVWELAGRPERLFEWFPDFKSSDVDGNIRTIVTNQGMAFSEELLVVDPLLRRLQYRLDLPIVRFHRGTLDVIELRDTSTLMVYATECDPRIMALVIGSATQRALHEIKRQLEEGSHG